MAVGFDLTDGHDLINDLNAAGEEIVCMHGWNWRNNAEAILHAVAGQPYIVLPADFGEAPLFVGLSEMQSVCEVSRADLLRLRHSAAVSVGGDWYVSPLSYSQDPEPTGLPSPRLDIVPTPSESGPIMAMQYKRRWRRLSADDANARPNMPDEFEAALLHRARAKAMVAEGMYEEAAQENAAADSALSVLVEADQRSVINAGVARGGAGRFESRRPTQRLGPYGVTFVT